MVEKKINDIVIVGAGPAGLTASIYAARAGLSAVVLDELGAGGQLLSTILRIIQGFPRGSMDLRRLTRCRRRRNDLALLLKATKP